MEFEQLVHAIRSLNSDDAFRPRLDATQWRTFGGYLTPLQVTAGTIVIRQGEVDRSAYFLGQGSMQVYLDGAEPGTSRAVMLRPGALLGEVGLFSAGPRTAQVEAMTGCVLWSLRLPRFEEMMQRAPQVSLEVLRAAGAVMAVRIRANMAHSVAVA
ncbi:MAG: cyclic nucleotide-binding domain-containing protein [Burkholderiales bacterium]|nr:cyclic nucleotide-binding domain-containing protein [Burkholderiales bacterium]